MTSSASTTFSPARRRTSRICSDRPNFELIRHDVTQPIWLEVDEIYNLACPAAPGHYQYNPIKTTKTSVMGAINVLGMAKRCRAKVLQASTSEVYGDPEVHPQPESYRGSGESDRPARLLRRRQARRRDAVHGLPPHERRQHPHRANLQYLRPADAPVRRPRRLELHPPGAARARTSRSSATASRPARSAIATT